MMNFNFKTSDGRGEFIKTRVESIGLPDTITGILLKNNIRTIGGIVNRDENDLRSSLGISESQMLCIMDKLNPLALEIDTEFQENNQVTEVDSVESQIIEALPFNLPSNDDNDIVKTFADFLGTTKEIIESHTRKQEVVEMRNLVVYFLREYGDMSFPSIGRLLGGRDHTTIIHSYRKVKKGIGSRDDFEKRFNELISKAKSIKDRKTKVEQSLIPEIIDAVRLQKLQGQLEPKPKEISERNLKTLDLYREGLTLENIGTIVGVTRERVRQIVAKTIRQIAINESITRGITMDTDLLIEEERKKRKDARHPNKIFKEESPKEKRWSRYYLACKGCGTTGIPHLRNGLCEKCAGQFRAERRTDILDQHGNKCDQCGKTRQESMLSYGRDVYITKDKRVLCRGCFLSKTGRHLANSRWNKLES